MKLVTIKKISITNFKGIKNQTISFNDNTDIFGANGTGKTTIYDAFLWLLFGKNSEDKKDFSIKNSVDLALNRQEHEVEGIIEIDGEENSLRKIYKEKWTKKRGEETSEYTGNETLYYWDDVPMNQKVFQEKIANVLDESLFKLITNPYAFQALKWQERRAFLMDMAGEVTNEELAKGNLEYEALVANLTKGKTMEDYRKQIDASIKKAKEDLKAIPTRIDEVLKNTPEALDFETLKLLKDQKEDELNLIDSQIQNKSAAFDVKLKEINEKKIRLNNLKSEISIIETDTKRIAAEKLKPDTKEADSLKKSLDEKFADLKTANNGLQTLSAKQNDLSNTVKSIEDKIEAKRKEWGLENSKDLKLEDIDFCCPTCKREFEASDIESKKAELFANFQTTKNEKLAAINAQGRSLSQEKTNLENEIQGLAERIEKGKKVITALQSDISELEGKIKATESNLTESSPEEINALITEMLLLNADYHDKKAEAEQLESTIDEVPKVDLDELTSKRKEIQCEIDEIRSKLNLEVQIISGNERIKSLEQEEKTLSQQIANVEKTQFIIEKFEKFKMATVEAKVNSKFKLVKFKMFEEQVNGGEAPACIILVKGVPFADANTASKINAGIDIINTLCQYYKVSAPIFIDGAESIHDIIETESQLIRLVVSEGDKLLRVA